MLTPGTVVAGDFRIERALSEGGMGSVFVAEQLSTGAMRALKVIKSELLHQQKLRQRFEQEARVTSRIASDHVVSVVAAGIDPTLHVPWIAMELLSGQTLAEVVKDNGALASDAAIGIVTQLVHAIDAAHKVGVVHRDLKPENIFLAESRRSGTPYFVKVLDFGIARIIQEAAATHTDALGTPLWMAPEQAGSGDAVGTHTDIWSLGLIVFFLLTAKPYWLSAAKEGTALSIVRELCYDPLAPASERAKALGADVTLTPAFDAWFAECVARDPKARFASARLALAKLREALDLPPEDLAPAKASFPRSPSSRTSSADGERGITPSSGSSEPVLPDAKTELAPPAEAVKAAAAATGANDTGATPSGVVTKRSPEAPGPPAPKKRSRILIAAATLAVIVVGVTGARAYQNAREDRACNDTAAPEPCAHACSRGDLGACATVGERDAFPLIGAAARNQPDAVALLKRACVAGRGCGTLGLAGELGWLGSPNDSAAYYDKACASPQGSDGSFECGLALAHALEGPAGRDLPDPLKTSRSAIDLHAACDHDPDACGLAWLPKLGAPNKEIRDAYEKGCTAGSSLACNNLGTLYAEGTGGVEANPQLARDRFQLACDAGEAAACNNAGVVAGGFAVTPRVGPRGAITYKLRCAGPFHVGCAGWGDTVHPVPAGTPSSENDIREARALFDRACTMGTHIACVNLGALAYIGKGAPVDRARAEGLFASTCFKGDPGACGEQASALLNVRMDHPRDLRGGLGFMERACKGGEEDACAVVYGFMIDSLPAPKHEAEGVAGMKRLAEKGVYSHELAQMYETGAEGLPPDPAKAREIAIALCKRDWTCGDAVHYLTHGIGGPKNESQALDLLTRACEQDDLVSCTILGGWHLDGHIVGKDPTRAVALFEKSCNEGEWDGCEKLATAYATGEGARKDLPRAMSLAREACDRGHPGGCARVGIMLADGEGVARDVDAAVPYLAFACRRAAVQSCAKLTELKKPIPELDL